MTTSRAITASSLSYCFWSVASAILCEVRVMSPSVLAETREERKIRKRVRMGKYIVGPEWLGLFQMKSTSELDGAMRLKDAVL